MIRIAEWMRRMADLIDRAGAPKATGLTFTIEPGIGIVIHGWLGSIDPKQKGCRLWYLNDDEHRRAYRDQATH